MAKYNYAFDGYVPEKMARVVGRDLPISTKDSKEISAFIRKRSLKFAKAKLERVINMSEPMPYKLHVKKIPHRRGNMTTGRYPIKASTHFLKLLNSVESNAMQKGLDSGSLKIIYVIPQHAARPMRYGRHRGRQAKRTHVEIVVEEIIKTKKDTKQDNKKEEATQKQEIKKEETIPKTELNKDIKPKKDVALEKKSEKKGDIKQNE